MPKHITPPRSRRSAPGSTIWPAAKVADGSWTNDEGGRAYPVAVTGLAGTALLANGNTPDPRPLRAASRQGHVEYLLELLDVVGPDHRPRARQRPADARARLCADVSGLASTAWRPSRRCATRPRRSIDKAVKLTAEGQSGAGGWTYIPGGGDEGSVTVTQVQALRAAHNAGFGGAARHDRRRPSNTSSAAARPKAASATRWRSGGGPRLAISAAAVATLYNAGEYDAPVANRCLEYVWQPFSGRQELEQRRRPRLLLPALRLAGLLPGRRQVLGRVLSRPSAISCSRCKTRATAPGTATASARPTARRSR